MPKEGRPLHILYVGDYDPSGMCMSEVDLPKRLKKYYGGDHIHCGLRMRVDGRVVHGIRGMASS
jgi:hypothetical protein